MRTTPSGTDRRQVRLYQERIETGALRLLAVVRAGDEPPQQVPRRTGRQDIRPPTKNWPRPSGWSCPTCVLEMYGYQDGTLVCVRCGWEGPTPAEPKAHDL